MFAQPGMSDPKIGPSLCGSQREALQRDLAEPSVRPGASYGGSCDAFAAQIKADCIDTLGSAGDAEMMTCAAKFSMIGTARGASDEQRESTCEMGRMLYKN